jgi:hypothetical protein
MHPVSRNSWQLLVLSRAICSIQSRPVGQRKLANATLDREPQRVCDHSGRSIFLRGLNQRPCKAAGVDSDQRDKCRGTPHQKRVFCSFLLLE